VKTALITGVNGQDGSYLAEFLLRQGYRVVGTIPGKNSDNIVHIREKIEIIENTGLLRECTEKIIRKYEPDEIYNLAARASSKQLWSDPVATGEVNAIAVVGFLDAIHQMDRGTRFLQASSSEIFGDASLVPQNESTPIQPRNPYGVAKAFAHWMTSVYREQRGLFGCSCILYNHESPRRRKELVSRKISHGVAKIKQGLAKELCLGDLNARRDWGFAGDYVRAMWLALQQPAPGDYVVATGTTHSVREFCEIAFSHVGLRYQDYVIEDRESLRSPDAVLLMGDPGKAHRVLGWTPTVSFEELVVMMVDADLKLVDINPRAESIIEGKLDHGHSLNSSDHLGEKRVDEQLD
jgi:GDPmannose 4,6-dehydratase